MKLPDKMPRELLALIVDKVHYGAIEDTSPIIETYDLIAEYFNKQQQGINWQPIENIDNYDFNEIQDFIFYNAESDPSYSIGCTDINCLIAIDRDRFSYDKNEVKEIFSHFAEITPPEVK